MKTRIIYLDNAATTCPKPEAVYAAQDKYSRHAANPGRGAHKLALDCARTVHETRTAAARLLGLKSAQRLVFTPGCTYSINVALKGLPWRQNDVVLVSAVEHNAVMRPLQQLQKQRGIKIEVIPYAKKGILDLHAFIQAMLDYQPKLCVFSEASNVTGEALDLQAIAAICGAHKVPLMVDAAQTAGRSAYVLENLDVSIWCASGHKGLFGMPGVGLLYVSESIELDPLVTGGTGSQSEKWEMPADYPDHLETGTLPGPAIAALGAGIAFLAEKGIRTVVDREHKLTQRFLSWADRTKAVRVFGNRREGQGIGVVSFDIPGIGCDRVASLLDSQYSIAVRTGLHCAPSAHRALGTLQTGLVRVSFSYFNTDDEVDTLCKALETISAQRDIAAGV